MSFFTYHKLADHWNHSGPEGQIYDTHTNYKAKFPTETLSPLTVETGYITYSLNDYIHLLKKQICKLRFHLTFSCFTPSSIMPKPNSKYEYISLSTIYGSTKGRKNVHYYEKSNLKVEHSIGTCECKISANIYLFLNLICMLKLVCMRWMCVKYYVDETTKMSMLCIMHLGVKIRRWEATILCTICLVISKLIWTFHNQNKKQNLQIMARLSVLNLTFTFTLMNIIGTINHRMFAEE